MAVRTLDLTSSSRRLFVGHANSAVQRRPRLAIAGIKGIKDFLGEIGPATLIKGPGVGLAENLPPRYDAGGDIDVAGLGGRREIVGRLVAHFVKVHQYLGIPVHNLLDLGLALPLGQGKPVAVHIKQVMVGATSDPHLVMLHGVGIGIGRQGLGVLIIAYIAHAPVGILQGIDDHHGVVQHFPRLIGAAGGQVVGHEQGRFGGGGFIAMNAVGQVDHHGRAVQDPLAVAGSPGIGQDLQVVSDPVQLGDVPGAGYCHGHQIPALVGLAVSPQYNPVAGRRQGLEIAEHLPVAGEGLAGSVPQGLGIGGDVRIVVGIRYPAINGVVGQRSGDKEKRQQKHSRNHTVCPPLRPRLLPAAAPVQRRSIVSAPAVPHR
ncbi:hypothetical protein ES703_120168 [subsurface metagenome]